MKTLLMGLLACLMVCGSALAQTIVMTATVDFTLQNGSVVTLEKGKTIKPFATQGYAYLVRWDADNDLVVDGDYASELRRRYRDRETEQLSIDIAADLRAQRILPTGDRVARILREEIETRNRDRAIERLALDIRRLEAETARLRQDLRK